MTAIEWQTVYRRWQSGRIYLFTSFFLPPHLRHRVTVVPASDDLATIVDNCNAHPPTVGEYPPQLNQKFRIAHPRRTKAQTKTIALTSTHQWTTTPTRADDTPPFCWKRTRRQQKRAPHIHSVVKDIRCVSLDAPCARTRHRLRPRVWPGRHTAQLGGGRRCVTRQALPKVLQSTRIFPCKLYVLLSFSCSLR